MIGELAAIGAALAWAVAGLVIKPISTKFSSLSINSIKLSIGWIILTAIMALWGKLSSLTFVSWHSIACVISSGILGLAIGATLQIKSLSLIDVSKVYPIAFSSWFLFTALIASIFLGEPITYYTILGAILIALGITFLSSFSKVERREMPNTDRIKGIIFALLAGLCWAGGTNLVKLGLYGVDPLMVNVIRLPFAALLVAILTLGRGGASEYRRYNHRALIQVGISGFLGQAIGEVLFFISIQLAGATKAAILSSTSPLFIAPFSIIFLKEKLTKRVILGTIACALGILLTIM